MKSNQIKPSEIIAIILLGVPFLDILMSGIYSLPAMRVTKERDPWLTLLLSVGLAVTVFGIGLPTRTPLFYLAAVYGGSIILLLLARVAHGSLGHNLERFGMVHAVTLFLTLLLVFITRHATRIGA